MSLKVFSRGSEPPPIREHEVVQGPLRAGKPSTCDDTVSYGALHMKSSLQRHYEVARDHLTSDPVMRSTMLRLEDGIAKNRKTTFDTTLVRGDFTSSAYSDAGFHFDNKTGARTITWDPHEALMTKDLYGQSPALGYGHEALHALHHADNPQKFAERSSTPNTFYDNEEERVTIERESAAAANISRANALRGMPSEGRRNSHLGEPYHVNVANETESPDARATREYLQRNPLEEPLQTENSMSYYGGIW